MQRQELLPGTAHGILIFLLTGGAVLPPSGLTVVVLVLHQDICPRELDKGPEPLIRVVAVVVFTGVHTFRILKLHILLMLHEPAARGYGRMYKTPCQIRVILLIDPRRDTEYRCDRSRSNRRHREYIEFPVIVLGHYEFRVSQGRDLVVDAALIILHL